MGAWQSAAVALAIGFLIGAERERDGGPAGVRTFALAGLAGAVAALISPFALAAALAGAAVLMAAALVRPSPADPAPPAPAAPVNGNGWHRARLSAASAVALLVTVVLGGLAVTMPALAAGAGVATAVILLAKHRLHHVIRERITEL